MPSGTTFSALRIEDLSTKYVVFDAHGVAANATQGTTTNIDYTLTDDCELTGVNIIIGGGNYGDYACLQVVDLTGAIISALTGGLISTPGYVLNQFATNWYVSPTTDDTFDVAYPAKALTGMTLRIAYTSVGSTGTTFVAVNYKLHKCLS